MSDDDGTRVDAVRIGWWIAWCGRPVEVVDSTPCPSRRAGRYFLVEEAGGTIHRLHYYDDEQVTITPAPREGSR